MSRDPLEVINECADILEGMPAHSMGKVIAGLMAAYVCGIEPEDRLELLRWLMRQFREARSVILAHHAAAGRQ